MPSSEKKVKVKDTSASEFWRSKKGKELHRSRDYVPRFLFRAYSASSGGGRVGLNSTEAIVPHSFLDEKGHKSIYTIPKHDLKGMINLHLAQDVRVISGFSSWAASLPLVLQYGLRKHEEGQPRAHVCVVDTSKLPSSVSIFHVASLGKAGLACGSYPWEYLAYGKIDGSGFKAVPVSDLLKLGLYDEIPDISGFRWWGWSDEGWKDRSVIPVTKEEVKKLRNLAATFGHPFTLGITAALIAISRRNVGPDASFNEDDLKVFKEAVEDLEIPHEYGTRNSIVDNGAYIKGYPHIQQMLKLLDGLVALRWGRGRRDSKKTTTTLLETE